MTPRCTTCGASPPSLQRYACARCGTATPEGEANDIAALLRSNSGTYYSGEIAYEELRRRQRMLWQRAESRGLEQMVASIVSR